MLTANENDHYINGFIVTPHPRGTLPDLSRRRIVAPTSRHVVVEMDMCHQRRVNRPNRPCSDAIPPAVFVEKRSGKRQKFFSYQADEHTCRIEILQQHYVDYCGCLNDYMPIPLKLSNYSSCFEWSDNFIFFILGKKVNESWYTYNNEERYVSRAVLSQSLKNLRANFQCMEKWRKSAALEAKVEKQVNAQCPRRCSEDKYGVHVSIPYWLARDTLGTRQDSDKAMVWLSKQVTAQIKRIEAAGESAAVLKEMPLLTASDEQLKTYPLAEDFVKVSVYARKLDVCLIEEELSFSWDKLFSEIGGAMGLWVGMSIITIGELMELLTILAAICTRHLSLRVMRSRVSPMPTLPSASSQPPPPPFWGPADQQHSWRNSSDSMRPSDAFTSSDNSANPSIPSSSCRSLEPADSPADLSGTELRAVSWPPHGRLFGVFRKIRKEEDENTTPPSPPGDYSTFRQTKMDDRASVPLPTNTHY